MTDDNALDPALQDKFKRLHKLNDDLLQLDRNKVIAQRSLELSTPPSVTLDSVGTIVSVNLGMRDLLGYAAHELNGRSLMSIMPKRFHAEYQAGFAKFLSTGELNPAWREKEFLQFPVKAKDGTETSVMITYFEFPVNGDRYVVVSMQVDKAGGN